MDEFTIEVTGIGFGESVRWRDGSVWFTDWTAGEIRRGAEVVDRVASLPISIDWLADGSMVVVAGSAGELLREADDGSLVPWVDLSDENEFPWNEVAVGPSGIYLNGLGSAYGSDDSHHGIVALVGFDGSIRRVAEDLSFPNGMVLSGNTLIVAESHAHRLTAFPILPDGSLGDRRTWAKVDGSAPDGIAIDSTGTVWFADVPNRRCVGVREGGEIVRGIDLPDGCFSCAVGGAEGRTLYVATAEWPLAMMDSSSRSGRILSVEID